MNRLPFIVLLACLAVAAPCADTAVPPLVNYQGTLTDENGAAIPDGMKKLEFNLYDAPLAGNRVWGPQVFDNVPVIAGRFNVILGTTDNIGRSISDAFAGNQRYLGFKVGNVGTNLGGVLEIAPRQQILSTPFAMQANNAVQAQNAVNAVNASQAANANLLENMNLQQLIAAFRRPDYDSGWFRVSRETEYTLTHNLGTIEFSNIMVMNRRQNGEIYPNMFFWTAGRINMDYNYGASFVIKTSNVFSVKPIDSDHANFGWYEMRVKAWK